MKKNYPFAMKWNYGFLPKKTFLTLSLVLFVSLSFQISQSQNSVEPTSCIVFDNCPSNQTLCADTLQNGVLGANVFWSLPDVSHNCYGVDTDSSFQMLFELNEQLLSQQCWEFNYISRVGTSGGSVKLFNGNDNDGDGKSKIITPFLILEDDTNVSIELNYVNGNYAVELFLVPPDNSGDLSLGSQTVNNNQNVYNWAANFDPGDGDVTGVSGVFRLKFVFTYTGQRPSNANSGDTIIAVKGFLNPSDNCSAGVDFTVSGPSTGFFPVGSHDLVYVAIYTSPTGEEFSQSCQFNITVVDVTLDIAVVDPNCTETGSITAVAGDQGLPQFGTAPYSYTLTPGNVSNETGFFDNLGGGDYYVSVTDANNCTTTSELISLVVVNNNPPSITAPNDITFEGCATDDIENISALPFSTLESTITEAQFLAEGGEFTTNNNATFTYIDVASGSCPVVITRTFTITDDCDNSETASQILTIEDTTAPTFVEALPTNTTVECDAVPTAETLTATDNCGDASVTFAEVNNPGTCIGEFTLIRTWTATDECGNEATHTQTITVQDTTAPVFVESLPADITVECDAIPTAEILTATDNCNTDISVDFSEKITEGRCTYNYILYRTWIITDDCKNQTIHTQTINVVDTTAPTFVEALPADATVECDAIPTAATLTATDNCGTATVTFNEVENAGTCSGEYTLVRTWTATDECSNETTHTQTIIVVDNTAPTFVEALPADATVECDAIPTAVTLTATDNCGTATVTFNEVENAGTCSGEYTLVRTWTATDECGNETVHTQTITVQDTTAPTFVESLPADATVECDAVPTAETLTATDDCGTATVTYNEVENAGACAGEYTLVRTWTATDECGNETVHTQTITVQDTTAPTFIEALPADNTVECDAIPTAQTLTATDNCGTATVTFNEVENTGACAGDYTLVRTWTATDECGNETIHTQTISVVDTTAPIAPSAPADFSVECIDDVPAAGDLTATDNCAGDITVTGVDTTDNSNPCEVIITRTWTFIDDCNNSTTVTQTITVADTTAPEFEGNLPSDILVECDAVPTAVLLTATDNCTANVDVEFTEVRTDGDCPSNYILTRTWTATDECDNTTTHSQIVTVQDTTAPTITTVAADQTVLCDGSGNTDELQAWLETRAGANATDNCGSVTWSNNFTGLIERCGETGLAIVTFTATDECGNSSSTTALFTIIDLLPPTINNPATNLTVECDETNNALELQAWLDNNGGATASDNCSDLTWTNNFTELSDECGSTGSATVIFTATDDCGNSSTTTATFTIEDNTAPTFVEALPADATVECDDLPNAVTLTATDSCSTAEVTFDEVENTGACAGEYTLIRTWTATDECGNETVHTQTITVVDTNVPTFVEALPADATVECNDVPAAVTLTATDSCGTATVTFNENENAGACAGEYTIVRTWTATDECGNETVHTQTITVVDTTAPTFVEALPADATVECNDVPAAVTLTANDACGTATVTFNEIENAGACAGEYTIVRTWTATDECGNETVHTQTISVVDTTNPVLTVPVNITVECNSDTTPANTGSATATDTCGDVTITFSDAIVETCGNTQIITRTWTATDDCGNTTSSDQIITTQDTTNPIISIPAQNIIIECDGSGSNDAIQNWLDTNGGATATDSCGDITWTNNYNGADSDCALPVEVTFTATDECGNIATTTATYAIQDTTAPVIDTPASDLTVACDSIENNNELQNWLNNNAGAIATDDCSSVTWSNDFSNLNQSCGLTGNVTVIFTATDGCGNTATTEATFTIVDTTAPTFVEDLPADATVECDAVPTAQTLTATDNCGTATVTFNEVENAGACSGEYTLVRTWTATDECGNETIHTQTITVQDSTAPTFVESLPADATVECDAVPTAETLTATDNCGDATVTFIEVENAGACAGEYTLVRTWTATDECGNETVHTQTITVQDTTAPTFVESLPADASVECGNVPTAETLTATDNCGKATVTFNEVENAGACEGEYTLVRTWTATDECGNETIHTQTITVQDTTAPTFVEALPADATVECGNVPTAEILTATDNCGTATVTFNEVENAGACAGEYTLVRTWTATDECGNETVHTQTITVQDTTAPTFVEALPADVTVECDAVPTTQTLTATDDCGTATVTFNEVENAGACAGEYDLVRTWTATDECGNETVHTQTISVRDTTAPSLTNSFEQNIFAICNDIPEVPELVFEDACSNDISVVFIENSTQTDIAQNYQIIREWTVTDDCGNESVFTQTINVSVKVDVSAIQASICIEDIEVDLFDYLPNDISQSGTWTVVTGNADLDGSTFDPSTVELGDYTFRYNSNNDVCFTQVILNLNVNDDCVVLSCGEDNVEISKAVTPNNDLINDFFAITGIEDCGFVIEVEIFNRWGAKIFESKNYQNNWGGETSKSSVGNAGKVPTGTYYYIVKLRNSGLSPFTGPIYVATK